MGRYDPYREPNWGDKLFGWFLLGCLGLLGLAVLFAGLRWLWNYVTSHLL